MRVSRTILPLLLCAPAVASAQTVTDTRLKVTTWASGLSQPTTFTWIGPGEMFVIQKKDGMVRWIKDGVVLGVVLDLNVNSSSERGGLGIVADPDFATNGFVYVYSSASNTSGDSTSSGGWAENRVDRYTWNGSLLVNKFGPLVAFPFDGSQSNGDNHDGGVIRIGPDGKLYGQTGDLNRGRIGSTSRVEQNTAAAGSASVGGMFRLNTDGTIPSDNPFVTEADSAFHLWWSYGLRNGFGLTFDPVNDSVWDTENGPNVYDEVDRVPWGTNGGWLKIMGPDSRNATYGENNNTSYDASSLTYLVNSTYLDPVFSFKTPVGITAIGFIGTKRFPSDLWNQCIFGDNNNGNLYFCEMKADRSGFKLPTGLTDKVADSTAERNKILWGSGWGVPTDIQVGSDGYLYIASYGSNKIYRIRPLVDEVQVARYLLAPGQLPGGSEELAEILDAHYFTIRDPTLTAASEAFKVAAGFTLNSATPTAITLQLTNHYNRGNARIQLLKVKNLVTGQWDRVDLFVVGDEDVTRSVVLTNPSQYVDPTTFEVRLQIDSSTMPMLGRNAKSGVTLYLDLLRLDVTYP